MAIHLTYMELENAFLNVAMECRKIQLQAHQGSKKNDAVQ